MELDLHGIELVVDLDGELEQRKEKLISQLRSYGATVAGVVSPQTRYVLTTDSMASKNTRTMCEASRLGVPVLRASVARVFAEDSVANLYPWLVGHARTGAVYSEPPPAGSVRLHITLPPDMKHFTLLVLASSPIYSLLDRLKEHHASSLPAPISRGTTGALWERFALYHHIEKRWLTRLENTLDDYGINAGSEHTLRLMERFVLVTLALPSGTLQEVKIDRTVPIHELQVSLAQQTGYVGSLCLRRATPTVRERRLSHHLPLISQGVRAECELRLQRAKRGCGDRPDHEEVRLVDSTRNSARAYQSLRTQAMALCGVPWLVRPVWPLVRPFVAATRKQSGDPSCPAASLPAHLYRYMAKFFRATLPCPSLKGLPRDRRPINLFDQSSVLRPMTHNEVPLITALGLQADLGGGDVLARLDKTLIPASLPVECRTKDVIVATHSALQQLHGMRAHTAELQYLFEMRQLHTMNLLRFPVDVQIARSVHAAILAVTSKHLTLYLTTGKVLRQHPLEHLQRWSARDVLELNFSINTEISRWILHTPDAAGISSVLQRYTRPR